jgi:hypothetical protein
LARGKDGESQTRQQLGTWTGGAAYIPIGKTGGKTQKVECPNGQQEVQVRADHNNTNKEGLGKGGGGVLTIAKQQYSKENLTYWNTSLEAYWAKCIDGMSV